MPQKDVFRVDPEQWTRLEPVMRPEWAKTEHGVLKPAGAGLLLNYPAGQILRGKTDGSNEYAKKGESGYAGPARLLVYPVLINEFGQMQITTAKTWDSYGPVLDANKSIEMYYRGYFACDELVGGGGTAEVQTQTLDTDVDGGTYTLTVEGYTTAPIAWNASNAAIQAALEALPNVDAGDIVVTGTTTEIFTFGGKFADKDVPLIVPDYSGLTDGGIAVAGDTSAIVQTTPGAGLLTDIGVIHKGTIYNGIMKLDA